MESILKDYVLQIDGEITTVQNDKLMVVTWVMYLG